MKKTRIQSTFTAENPAATARIGQALGEELRFFSGPHAGAFCIALSGELGAGKTFFTKALAKGLGVRSRIQSPTFVLMKRYPLKGGRWTDFWHMDCYRIKDDAELGPIGFFDVIADPNVIIAIEWPELIAKHIPKNSLKVQFAHVSEKTRTLSLSL